MFAPISREGALVFNNLFLTTACATVFVGTLYPLALEALTGDKISVGAPFFNATFGPLFLPLMIAMPFGPLLAWKRGDLYGAAQRLMLAFAIALIAMAATFAIEWGGPVLAPFLIGVAFFAMTGSTDRSGRTRAVVPPAIRSIVASPCRFAAFLDRDGRRAFRAWRLSARHRLRGQLRHRAHSRDEARPRRYPCGATI